MWMKVVTGYFHWFLRVIFFNDLFNLKLSIVTKKAYIYV